MPKIEQQPGTSQTEDRCAQRAEHTEPDVEPGATPVRILDESYALITESGERRVPPAESSGEQCPDLRAARGCLEQVSGKKTEKQTSAQIDEQGTNRKIQAASALNREAHQIAATLPTAPPTATYHTSFISP